MRELWANLRRRPHGAAELAADGLRLLAVVSIVLAGVGWGAKGVSSFAVVSVAMLLPRALAVRPGFDIAYGVIALAATWSSVTDLYGAVRWLDLPMHFLMTGLAAASCYVLLLRLGLIAEASALRRPRTSAVVLTTTIGAALAAAWEMFEWFTTTFLDPATVLGYQDTIADMVFGTAGSFVAGLLMPVLAAQPTNAAPPTTIRTS
ncbi:hypothetical protein ACFPER_10815 [Agromyces aurantiacus]|uniref:DUF2238 domain-containing protein n=1 Tax=Agromyces aurantiacus TaxID=165814 RepID=A0ABV9R590_9MICO|nr:hypothetical protein [Agromyces aurantiacus]MBM7503971.1 uncharacterized membrane protein YuzA (DUF378 family) [Agromyces aurantiacus]